MGQIKGKKSPLAKEGKCLWDSPCFEYGYDQTNMVFHYCVNYYKHFIDSQGLYYKSPNNFLIVGHLNCLKSFHYYR